MRFCVNGKKLKEMDRQTDRHADKLPKWFLALHFAAKKTDPLSALEKNSDLDPTFMGYKIS